MALMPTWQDGLAALLLHLSTAPAGLPDPYLHAYTDLPSLDGGYLGTEPAGADGYVGPIHVAGDAFWTPVASQAGFVLNADITLGTPTADWGPIVGWALTDLAGGVLVIEPVEFDDPQEFALGVPAVFTAGMLGFTVI